MPSRITRNCILTKDIILRRAWTISRMLWNILKCAFNLLDSPDNTHELLDSWIRRLQKLERQLMLVGISALFWTIWRPRNNYLMGKGPLILMFQ